uniref:Brevican n=1 Tax=Oryzias melastigma TaxID=30732 RepID=A0A3B3BEQ2_ORYME
MKLEDAVRKQKCEPAGSFRPRQNHCLFSKTTFCSSFAAASPPRIRWRSSGALAGKVVLPCHFFRTPLAASTSLPLSAEDVRVKWVKLEEQEEKLVLVAQDGEVMVGKKYRGRVSVPIHRWDGDASLVMDELRASDAGLYRCEVVEGMDSIQDTVSLNVSGVVFYYNKKDGPMTFYQAIEACQAVHASIATPEQLYAAFYDGMDQCSLGWLADRSVRYPISRPREGCEGDLGDRKGVRSYDIRDPSQLNDVYCFIDQLNGEVFYPPSLSEKLTFQQAREECEKHDAVLASTGQLFAAWRAGLNRCDYGWLSDGSVRYPINVPLPQCGGGQLGVRSLHYPDPEERYGAYCFRGKDRWNLLELSC